MTGVELKEFSLLYLVLNNLNLLQANIHLIENIKLFTEINKKIFELIIEKLKSGEQIIHGPHGPHLTCLQLLYGAYGSYFLEDSSYMDRTVEY